MISELRSEQKLASLIPSVLRYVLAAATRRFPRYLLPIFNSFDEVYTFLTLLVERHFLLTYGGGLTENFYGIKRERVPRIRGSELPRARKGAPSIVREILKPGERDVWKNLAVMVGLPYLKRKVDESYEIYISQAAALRPRYHRDHLTANATIKQRILYYYKWFLRHVYPSIHAIYHFSLLAFNLLYLFDSSKYHSPLLWLIGIRMRRLSVADTRTIAEATRPRPPALSPPVRPGQASSMFTPRMLQATIYPRISQALQLLLPTSIFALEALEWWYASDFARKLSKKATEGLELPPPTLFSGSSPANESTNPPPPPSFESDDNNQISTTPFRPGFPDPPIAASTHLPVLTVSSLSLPLTSSSSSPASLSNGPLCPICRSKIITPTACQTGYVFCYTCIFRWIDGSHDRQKAFMEGAQGEEGWGDEEGNRVGKWESGKGRCAVTGQRILGGTDGLRRIMV